MTTAFKTDAQPSSGPSESAKMATVVVLGLGLAGFLAIAGITFLSVALALPIALSIAGTYNAWISPSDVALATQLNAFTPAFVVVGIASLVGSLVAIVKLIQRIDRTPAA